MSIHEYQREFIDGGWNVDSVNLRNAIRRDFPGVRFRILIPGAEPSLVRVTFDADLDSTEVAALNAIYAQNKLDTDPLKPLRTRLIKMVDTNTRALFAQGFEYPVGSGQMFSLSIAAQTNINTLRQLAADGTRTVFPLPIPFLDDSGELVLKDAGELAAWGTTGAARGLGIRVAGSALKAQLRAAITNTVLNAFRDART